MKVQSRVQKWGNGLAIRIAGVMRDIPHFQDGTPIEVEVTEEGLLIKKLIKPGSFKFPYSEHQILANISEKSSHADLLAKPLDSEF